MLKDINYDTENMKHREECEIVELLYVFEIVITLKHTAINIRCFM